MPSQDQLSSELLAALRRHGLKIVTAESCTGGLLAGALTEIPGSSEVFERGFVTYSNEAKAENLGVPPALVTDHGAVSEEVAAAMAIGALANSNADVSVAVTGIAGPGGSDHKPEGLVWFATAIAQDAAVATKREFGPLGRSQVRKRSVEEALRLVLDRLK